jgi:SAM-dependent methyltransferase
MSQSDVAVHAFERGEVDYLRDLQILQDAVNYRRWIFAQIEPYLGSRVLEIGAGIGNYTEKLLRADLVIASDHEERYLNILRRRFGNHPNVEVQTLDLSLAGGGVAKSVAPRRCDTAIALNVIEHIENDQMALETMRAFVTSRGRIILICPAHERLYTELDRAFGHYRRYNRRRFLDLAAAIDVEVERLSFFNALGTVGWLLNGGILRRRTLPAKQTMLYDRVVPLLRRVESVIPLPFGLSILAVLKTR